jgi:hypothetical protein
MSVDVMKDYKLRDLHASHTLCVLALALHRGLPCSAVSLALEVHFLTKKKTSEFTTAGLLILLFFTGQLSKFFLLPFLPHQTPAGAWLQRRRIKEVENVRSLLWDGWLGQREQVPTHSLCLTRVLAFLTSTTLMSDMHVSEARIIVVQTAFVCPSFWQHPEPISISCTEELVHMGLISGACG